MEEGLYRHRSCLASHVGGTPLLFYWGTCVVQPSCGGHEVQSLRYEGNARRSYCNDCTLSVHRPDDLCCGWLAPVAGSLGARGLVQLGPVGASWSDVPCCDVPIRSVARDDCHIGTCEYGDFVGVSTKRSEHCSRNGQARLNENGVVLLNLSGSIFEFFEHFVVRCSALLATYRLIAC